MHQVSQFSRTCPLVTKSDFLFLSTTSVTGKRKYRYKMNLTLRQRQGYSDTLLEEQLALEVSSDLAVGHNTTVLRASTLVDINDSDWGLLLLLVGLDVLLPVKLTTGTLGSQPEDGILPQRSALHIALLDAPDDAVSSAVVMRVTRSTLFEDSQIGLGFGVIDRDLEGLGLRFVGAGRAGDCICSSFKGRGLLVNQHASLPSLQFRVGFGLMDEIQTYHSRNAGFELSDGSWSSKYGRNKCESNEYRRRVHFAIDVDLEGKD